MTIPKIFLYLIISTTLLTSCKKPLEQKFKDKEPIVKCNGLDYNLAHEAYYSFLEDIAVYLKNQHVGYNYLDYPAALGAFIYKGSSGTADYEKIASPHTIEILKRLKKETTLWDTSSKKSNLNYNSEFMDCIIQNIKNEDLKQTIISLREVNSLNSKILNEVYTQKIYDYTTDNYFGVFIAFDTYYQYLYDIDFKNNK